MNIKEYDRPMTKITIPATRLTKLAKLGNQQLTFCYDEISKHSSVSMFLTSEDEGQGIDMPCEQIAIDKTELKKVLEFLINSERPKGILTIQPSNISEEDEANILEAISGMHSAPMFYVPLHEFGNNEFTRRMLAMAWNNAREWEKTEEEFIEWMITTASDVGKKAVNSEGQENNLHNDVGGN